MLLKSIIFITVATFPLGKAAPLDRIVGGTISDIKYAPYQVSVQWFKIHFCGGSILSKNIILTAAHCTEDVLDGEFTIRAGSTFNEEGGQYVKVTKIIRHENFDPITFNNDVAILVLNENLEFNSYVKPINLATSPDDAPVGEYALVTGWGKTSERPDDEGSDILREVLVKIMSMDECKGFYKNKVNELMLCAGYAEGGKDSCQGDSGGPLVYNDKLIGVVSWGIDCARPQRPGIYVNVAKLHDWIENKIEKFSKLI